MYAKFLPTDSTACVPFSEHGNRIKFDEEFKHTC